MPLSPFFKGGIFSVRFSPLFAKEGKGRFFDGMTRELSVVGNAVQRVTESPTRTMAKSLEELDSKFKNRDS